ncbi:unnamed protein product [Trichobilharzia regenti]|nr:unnamed protein product [Trichobilharzia regenti]
MMSLLTNLILNNFEKDKNLFLFCLSPFFITYHQTTTLLVIGTTLFSGSCYYVAISGNESASKFAPIGGLTLLLAWISMIL